MSAHPGPAAGNADQIEFWNGAGGEKWLRAEERLEHGLSRFGVAALDAAAAQLGEAVIDIGCGTGPTSLVLARSVGASGRVLGLDVSTPLIEQAKARARAAGATNAEFVVGDASTHPLRPEYDLLFSRFGVMFFADPASAFAHLRGALKPGGRLAFVCWRSFKENGWAFVPFMAAIPHLPPIERPAPNAPGPFAFADADRVRGILGDAGFKGIEIAAVDRDLPYGGSLDEALRFVTDFGPLQQPLAQAPAESQARAVAAVREALGRLGAAGPMTLPGACWLVKARN